jgi:hypothetical protein
MQSDFDAAAAVAADTFAGFEKETTTPPTTAKP